MAILGLRQDSPAAMRILAHLEAVAPSTRYDLAVTLHIDQRHAARLIRTMHLAGGLIHISDWVRPSSGHGAHAAVYKIGPGVDKEKPAMLSGTEKKRRYRAALIEKYGASIANKITRSRKYGGADRIAVDGQTVYQRGIGVLA